MNGNTDRMLSPLFTWRSAVASKESKLTATQRHVALTLSLHMSERGDSCFPSMPTLADETGLGLSTVRKATGHMHEAGWLVRKVRRGRQSNLYTAVIPDWYLAALGPPAASGHPTGSERSPRQQGAVRPPAASDKGVIEDDIEGGTLSLLDGNVQSWNGPGQINGTKVTKQEALLAQEVLTAFNERSGKRFSGKEWLASIVRRVREHPDVSLERHKEIIDQQFGRPWWKDDPTPSVIYGNGKVFDRALNSSLGPAKREPKYTRPSNA